MYEVLKDRYMVKWTVISLSTEIRKQICKQEVKAAFLSKLIPASSLPSMIVVLDLTTNWVRQVAWQGSGT
jgi:hypothetical protein